MEIIDFSKSNSIINKYMAEMRDKDYQKNRLLFRNNIMRVGELIAYELSKTFDYEERDIQTPLGVAKVNVPTDKLVLGTIFRAGLPFHLNDSVLPGFEVNRFSSFGASCFLVMRLPPFFPFPIVVFGFRFIIMLLRAGLCLRLALALHIFLKEHVLAVEHGICELRNPVAENHDACLLREEEVELDVPVAEHEVVDVRVGLHVLLGIEHQMFAVLAHVGRLFAVGTLQSGVLSP